MKGKIRNKKEYSVFCAKVDLDAVDEKLRRFIELRNEMVILANELGLEVKQGLLEVTKK